MITEEVCETKSNASASFEKGTDESQHTKSLPKKGRSKSSVPKLFLHGFYASTIVTWCALLLCLSLHYIDDQYIDKIYTQLEFDDDRREVEITYYDRACDASDFTTTDLYDITIFDEDTLDDAVDLFMTHGGVIIPQILSPNTTSQLRSYIIEQNYGMEDPEDQYYVHEHEHRWSLKLGAHDDPSVSLALKEIGEHEVLKPLIEEIAGLHPSVCEITSISSAYGAEAQWWHSDVGSHGSPVLYGSSIRSTYTLFIPLQYTHRGMGATAICPGSNMCPYAPDTYISECDELDLFAEVDGGTGYLMDQTSWHRGGGHNDPDAPDRVMFVVSFTSSHHRKGDYLSLPTGLTYSLRWDMWGHTIEDMSTIFERPWTMWNSLGIYKSGHWGWTYPMINLLLSATEGIEVTSHLDLRDEFQWFLPTVEKYLQIVYAALLLLSLLFAFYSSSQRTFSRAYLLRGHAIPLLIASSAISFFVSTEWAKTVYSLKKFTQPSYLPLETNVTAKYSRSLVTPKKSDILFGDRLDNFYIHVKRRFYDYHPGNSDFLAVLESGRSIYADLQVELKSRFITSIVASRVNGGKYFLRQNDYGDFVRMSTEAAFEETRRLLLREKNACVDVLSEKVKYITSQAKYGYWHKIGRRFVPALMNRLAELLLNEGSTIKYHGHTLLDLPTWVKRQEKKTIKTFYSYAMSPLVYKSPLRTRSSLYTN